jgi:hypothetical protein
MLIGRGLRYALAEGRLVEAVQLALAAWPRAADSGRPQLRLTIESLATALPQLRERLRLEGHSAYGTKQTSISMLNMSAFGGKRPRLRAAEHGDLLRKLVKKAAA